MTELKDLIFELWLNNWNISRRFFESKGNIKTKGRLKTKWCRLYDNFYRDLKKFVDEKAVDVDICENCGTIYNIENCEDRDCDRPGKEQKLKRTRVIPAEEFE